MTKDPFHSNLKPNIKHKKQTHQKDNNFYTKNLVGVIWGCVDSPQTTIGDSHSFGWPIGFSQNPAFSLHWGDAPQVPLPTGAQMPRNEITPLSRSRALRETPFRCISARGAFIPLLPPCPAVSMGTLPSCARLCEHNHGKTCNVA